MVAARCHDFSIDFRLRTSLPISRTKLRRMELLLKHMMEIWSRGQGEPEAFILLTILHILLYVGGERSSSTDGSLNFGFQSGIDFLKYLLHFCLSYSGSIRDGISINFLEQCQKFFEISWSWSLLKLSGDGNFIREWIIMYYY